MKKTTTILSFAVLAALPLLAAPIDFTTPEGWKKVEPKDKMRKAEYDIPAVEGDDKVGAKLIVYHFGAKGGGTVESNIERWKGQVKKEEGDPEPKQEERTCDGLKVIILDLQGTYTATPMKQGEAAKPATGRRLINALIETGEGNYFVKFIGPKKTIAENLKKFHAFIDGLKATEGAKPASQPTSKPGQ